MKVMKDYSWASLASLMAIFDFSRNLLHILIPPYLHRALTELFRSLFRLVSPYCYFNTETDSFTTNELYSAARLYLSSSASTSASCLSLAGAPNSSSLTFTLSSNGQLVDTFRDATVTWDHIAVQTKSKEKCSFTLRITKKDRPLVLESYLHHIIEKAVMSSKERIKTGLSILILGAGLSSVPFKHASTFDTLAMDPVRKAEIMDDLIEFAEGRTFYERTGRTWKRGYLLYGLPGTGKSSMIAAMANFLGYNVYDLELTMVHTNSELRRLLMNTSPKSIILIQDIDCSINLTNRISDYKKKDGNRVHYYDGLCSCCGSERIFVFTTNHIVKLDPILLRLGRMDAHIFMSYCSFVALRILLKNYMGVDDGGLVDSAVKGLEEVIDVADISEVLIKNCKYEEERAKWELLEV